MAYRAYRPQSATMVPFKKCRVSKMSFDSEKHLKFDPWSSIYKENFGPKADQAKLQKVLLTKNVELEIKGLRDKGEKPFGFILEKANRRPASAFSSQRKNKLDAKQPEHSGSPKPFLEESNCRSKENPPRDLGRSLRNQPGNGPSDSQTGPTVCVVKANEIPAKDSSLSTQAQTVKAASKPRPSSSYLFKPRFNDDIKTVEGLLERFPNIKEKNEELPFHNIIGQTEEWLDVKDKLDPPVHAKVVNYHPAEFLKANIKTLVNSVNEYYPFLTNKCMCNQCVCGSCRCVHFKYRPNGNCFSSMLPQTGTDSEYKTEFGPKKVGKVVRKVQPNEIAVVPTPMDFRTSNDLCFGPPKANRFNDPTFFLKAKINNIGPNVCFVPCPMDSQSSYKNDFPDWKCVGASKVQQFAPNTLKKNMPFMGKPVNREYGAFHGKGEGHEPVKSFMPENKNNVFPVLAVTDEVPTQSEYKRNFDLKELGEDPLKHFKPVDNLELEVS